MRCRSARNQGRTGWDGRRARRRGWGRRAQSPRTSRNAEGLRPRASRTSPSCSPKGSGQPGGRGRPGGVLGGTRRLQGLGEVETEPGVSNTLFTPRVPGGTAAIAAGETEPLEPGVNFCPNASKIGTVKIKTPLLPKPLEGAVYLAAQDANPFGSLVAMYIVAEDPVSGVAREAPGRSQLEPRHGADRLDVREHARRLPFEDAELHFFGGERAPLGDARALRRRTRPTRRSRRGRATRRSTPPRASRSPRAQTGPVPGPRCRSRRR